MVPLFLSFVLAAAPIPKSETYEGYVAVLSKSEKPTLILFTPEGEELKRVELNELIGEVCAFHLGKNRRCALVSMRNAFDLTDKDKPIYDYRVYYIDLNGKDKPKVLIQHRDDRDHSIDMVLNQDATIAYCYQISPKMDWDQKKNMEVNYWQLDLKTGKKKTIDLANSHAFVDITADGETILSWRWEVKDEKMHVHSVLLSTKTWKETFVSKESLKPRAISPDGKQVFLHGEVTNFRDGCINPTDVMDLASQSATRVPEPQSEKSKSINQISPGTNARTAVISEKLTGDFTNDRICRVFVMSIDGTKQKLIYEGEVNEQIKIDWK